MTLEEEMDGWTYDEVLKEWEFPFLRYRYKNGSRTTASVVVGFDGVRLEEGTERGCDYESYEVIPGREKLALDRFMSAETIGAQRLWWLALDTIDLYSAENDIDARTKACGRAFELGLIDIDSVIAAYHAFSDLGAKFFPKYRLEELMYLCICSAPWQVLDNDEPMEYMREYEKMAVDMMAQIHPEAADGLELFKVQIWMEFPKFKFNEPAARRYINDMLRMSGERFDLPDLDM